MIYPYIKLSAGGPFPGDGDGRLLGRAVCDDKNRVKQEDGTWKETPCKRETTVELVLGLAGGFMFEPPKEPGWQMRVSRMPGQPVQLGCPDHNRTVDTADTKLVKFGQKG